MRNLCIWVILILLVALTDVFTKSAKASPGFTPWIVSELAMVQSLPVQAPNDTTRLCAGRVSLIEVADAYDGRQACVFGNSDGERMAKYHTPGGEVRYAFSFRTDEKFYALGSFCQGIEWCVYSQSEDAAVGYQDGVAVRIEAFSSALRRQSGTPTSYTVNTEAAQHLPLQLASSALSHNERWATFEVRSQGVIRVDMNTGIYRWAASHPFYGANPISRPLDLAISDDGLHLVVAGWHGGIRAYEVAEYCGYEGGVYTQYGYVGCHYHELEIRSVVEGYVHAQNLRFSSGGMKLTGTISTQSGYIRATFSPKSQFVHGAQMYLAFGDSFTSGEGETDDIFYLPGTNEGTNKCHVSSRSYPYLLGRAWEYLVENKACSGSRTVEVLRAIRSIEDWQRPAVVSLGVGGNDVDVMGKLKTCLGIDTCSWAKPENRAATALEIKAVLPKLIATIQELQGVTSAPLFVVGYPLVINEYFLAPCRPLIQGMLNAEERRYMGETIRHLNKVLDAAAQFTGTTYISIEDAFSGERLCDISEASMNGVRTGDDIAPIASLPNLKVIGAESFHPTPVGHARTARHVQAALGDEWWLQACAICSTIVTPSEYWGIQQNAQRQLLRRFFSEAGVVPGATIRVSFPRFTFTPGQPVRFELHSEPHDFGHLVAGSDGSLSGELSIPNVPGGQHAIHAFGQTYSGEEVSLYQTVHVANDAQVPEAMSDSGGDTSAGQAAEQEAFVPSTPGVLAVQSAVDTKGSAPTNEAPSRQSSDAEDVLVKLGVLLGAVLLAGCIITVVLSRRKV